MASDHVLVRAQLSADGRTVTVAPGVELAIASVVIAADLPAGSDDMPHGLVLMFETLEDRAEFVRTYQAEE